MFENEKAEIVKNSIKALMVAAFMALVGYFIASSEAYGSLVRELEPGIVELAEGQDGSLVIDKISFDSKHKWVYFSVAEKSRLSARMGVAAGKMRYFYGPASDFNLKPSMKIAGIQYGVQKRIINAKGRIPFGQQKYFYPVLVLETQK